MKVFLGESIQKRNKLNDVYAEGEKGNGGAYHKYTVQRDTGGGFIASNGIKFQDGARNEAGSTFGVLDVDLLEICRHRLQCFQAGEYASRENAIALTHIEEALLWLNKRVEDRAERNVLGTTER